VSGDTLVLADAIGANESERTAITPWALPEPTAPSVAARSAGIQLSIPELANSARCLAGVASILLVEGVGGLLCPLTERETVADLVRELRLPMIVVARRSLGTLNHTLLTLEVAQRRGLKLPV